MAGGYGVGPCLTRQVLFMTSIMNLTRFKHESVRYPLTFQQGIYERRLWQSVQAECELLLQGVGWPDWLLPWP